MLPVTCNLFAMMMMMINCKYTEIEINCLHWEYSLNFIFLIQQDELSPWHITEELSWLMQMDSGDIRQ